MKNHKVVILHDDDLDGVGAAYATWWWCRQYLNTELAFFSTGHMGGSRKIVPQLPHDTKELVVLDWVYPPEQLFNLHVPVTVIDHHQYGFDAFKEFFNTVERGNKTRSEYDWGTVYVITATDKGNNFKWVYAPDHSAATLAWYYWNGYVPLNISIEPIPPILLHIEDRDLWNWELPYTDEYTIALESYIHKYGFKALKNLYEEKPNQISYVGPYYPRLFEQGKAMILYRDMIAEQQAATFTAQERIKDSIPYGLANLSHTISETHHAALALHSEWAFTMSYFITGDENVIFNLRSRKEGLLYDVGKLAKSLGGGGHFSSAGFPISLKEFAGLQI